MCILLVEDEAFIREILSDELSFHGHDVCEASSGDQAANLIAKPPKAFSLLITDINMPGQRDGVAVARLIRRHHPDIPIIYMTGRPDAAQVIGALGVREVILIKPFRPAAVIAAVEQLLAA